MFAFTKLASRTRSITFLIEMLEKGMEKLERSGVLDNLSPEAAAYYKGMKVSEYYKGMKYPNNQYIFREHCSC